MIPPAGFNSLSTSSRMVIAAVCQPLAASPRNIEPRAASSSRWKGCGSNSAAKLLMRSFSTRRRPEPKVCPTTKSSRYSPRIAALSSANIERGPSVPEKGVTMRTQAERARTFRALHERPGIFVMPNPWDAGTAKLFASLGFEALATTSLGLANALGRVDGALAVGREELIANCRDVAAATDLPVNADLENGYADDPAEAAPIIRLAADAGIVCGSIEDGSGDHARPIYDFNLAVERVPAAAEAAR